LGRKQIAATAWRSLQIIADVFFNVMSSRVRAKEGALDGRVDSHPSI
jgi:hypothetical protein